MEGNYYHTFPLRQTSLTLNFGQRIDPSENQNATPLLTQMFQTNVIKEVEADPNAPDRAFHHQVAAFQLSVGGGDTKLLPQKDSEITGVTVNVQTGRFDDERTGKLDCALVSRIAKFCTETFKNLNPALCHMNVNAGGEMFIAKSAMFAPDYPLGDVDLVPKP